MKRFIFHLKTELLKLMIRRISHLLTVQDVKEGILICNNIRYTLPVVKNLGEYPPNPEQWQHQLLSQCHSSSLGTFVDVGVNLGQTFLNFKSQFKGARYVGFEPNPACVFYVNELIRLNQIDNCQVLPVGLSNKTELKELIFFGDSNEDSSATVIENFRSLEDHRCWISLVNIEQDKSFPLEDVRIIKIDVEGGELEVLEGLKTIIKRDKPVILIEVLPIDNRAKSIRAKRFDNLNALVTELGYLWYRILKDGDRLIGLQHAEDVRTEQNLNRCDYLLGHPSNSSKFDSLVV